MHEVKTKQNPMTRNWLWSCSCGKNGWGFPSREQAHRAASGHAAMSR